MPVTARTDSEQIARFAPGHDPRQRRRPQPELAEDRDVAAMTALFAADSWALVAPGVPAYGSAAYLDLDDDDPLRLASAICAAMSWFAAEHGLGAPASRERLERLVGDALRQASHDVAGAADWSELSADLDDGRRARARRNRWRATAADPRPGDYPGVLPSPRMPGATS